MNEQNILDYVLTSPYNTNPAILKQKLREYGGGTAKPLVLNVDNTEDYKNNSEMGDIALAAVLAGRQILVRVPNADGGNYTAIYCPIMMYQLPNHENEYLYLFFLRDEKQDLSAILGQPAGTVAMPTYGELKMKLSQKYTSSPLSEKLVLVNKTLMTFVENAANDQYKYRLSQSIETELGRQYFVEITMKNGTTESYSGICETEDTGNNIVVRDANGWIGTVQQGGDIYWKNPDCVYITIYTLVN